MNRTIALVVIGMFLAAELGSTVSPALGEGAPQGAADVPAMDLFDAMQRGDVEAKFIARSSERGRIVMENKTDRPLNVEIPDAFIGVPLAQMGGGMMGGMGGGMGGQQSVGGGGGGNRGGGRGGGGRGRGGGGFNIPPERIVRVDVDLLCLDHGKKDPSSSKPYAIRPIENFIKDPAVIAIVSAYGNGDLPPAAAQAAVWHANSEVSWNELASKLTGTKRNKVREPYFSAGEIRDAMTIVQQARQSTAGQKIEPRPFKLPGEKDAKAEATDENLVSPGDEEVEGDSQSPAEEPIADEAAEAADAEVASGG